MIFSLRPGLRREGLVSQKDNTRSMTTKVIRKRHFCPIYSVGKAQTTADRSAIDLIQCFPLTQVFLYLDHRSYGETGFELMRPYLHEFLTAVYPYYDIGIWCK